MIASASQYWPAFSRAAARVSESSIDATVSARAGSSGAGIVAASAEPSAQRPSGGRAATRSTADAAISGVAPSRTSTAAARLRRRSSRQATRLSKS